MFLRSRRFRPKSLAVSAGIAVFALSAGTIGTAHAATPAVSSATAAEKSSTSSSSASSAALTARRQALAQARSTGKAVPIASATTAYSTLTAESNGQLQLTDADVPQRAQVDGSWKPLDPTLKKNTDGTWSPEVASAGLKLSPGGAGPLVTMTEGTYGLSLTLPSSLHSLPAPSVTGAAATYRNVLPGVNLVVTAAGTGGFSEVFEVENAAAAADPALATLAFGTETSGGVTVSADRAGNLTARDPRGTALFTAPVPEMWDSATSTAVDASAVTDPHSGARLDKYSGTPVASSPAGAGAAAHTARLGVSASHGTLTLTPDQSLLHGKDVAWPLYIDPTWSATGEDANNWTYTSSEYNTTSYWDIPTKTDYLHAGYIDPDYDTDGYNSNDIAYFQYNMGDLAPLLSHATVNNVFFYTDDVWSDSCTAEATDLYYTGAISSATTASNAPGWGTELESQSFAHGWDSSCQAQDVTWNSSALTGLVQSQANGGISRSTTLTLALRADNETNPLSWRKFDQANTQLTIDYDQAPNTPTAAQMSTSPATPCSSTEADAAGLGPMHLYSYVSSPMGSQNPLEYEFELWNTATGSSSHLLTQVGPSSSLTTGNDSYAGTTLPQSDFTSSGSNWTGGAVTEFSWRVQVSDGLTTSQWSPTCTFYYDPTIPGAPSFTDDSTQCDTGAAIGTAGTAITFPVTYNTDASVPSSFRYQLNTGGPATITAVSGGAAITVTPTQRVNTLAVTEVSPGGNIGQTADCQFTLNAAPNAVDRDMNDDGIPDLLTAGQTDISSTEPGTAPYEYTADTSSSIPAGLYLAEGIADSSGSAGTGPVQSNATDVGANGTNYGGDTPASFNGSEIDTGQFTANGFDDVLAYDPATDAGAIIPGNGNGLDLQAQLGVTDVGGLSDVNGDYPAQLVSAYDAASGYNPTGATPYTAPDTANPDLLGISGSSAGYYLEYYLTSGQGTFGYAGLGAAQLTNESPDGTMDWQDWVVSSTQIDGGVDFVLWKPTSGELCLWQNAQLSGTDIDTDPADIATGPWMYGTASLTYTGSTISACGQELSADFHTGTQLATLETADIDGSGIPAVWTVTPGATGNVAWTAFSGLSTTAGAVATSTGDASAPQSLATTSHAWDLNDGTGGAVGTAADSSGPLDLTNSTAGSTAASWNTGSNFSPDLALDSSHSGSLTSSGGALTPNGSWTVDIWADPASENGTLWSQNGADDPVLGLAATSSGQWQLSVNNDDGDAYSFTDVAGGTVDLNQWTEVTATYNSQTDLITLYADGNEIAVAADTSMPADGTGDFVLGAWQSDGSTSDPVALTNHYDGQLADARVWTSAVAPTTATTLGSDYVPVNPVRVMDTRENGTSGKPYAGATLGPVASDSTTVVPIAGSTVGGVDIPSTGVTAVAVSITAVSESTNGFLTAYPDGTPLPVTSTLNYAPSTTLTNGAIVPVGTDGDIDVYNSSTGTAQLIVDVTGYYTTATSTSDASTYVPLADPSRALSSTAMASDSKLTLAVAGNKTAGIPADTSGAEITGVAINLTATNSTTLGELTAYPDGEGTAGETATTSLTYDGANLAAALIVKVGTDGDIDIYNSSATAVDVIGDISGYYTTATTGQMFHALSSTRILDTRYYNPDGATAAPAPADSTTVVPTPAGINATDPTLVLNVTVAGGTSIGFLSVYPNGQSMPQASAINWGFNQITANLNVAASGGGGKIDLYNNSTGTVQLIIDTDGYFD